MTTTEQCQQESTEEGCSAKEQIKSENCFWQQQQALSLSAARNEQQHLSSCARRR